MTTQGQGYSLTVVQGHSDLTISNSFSSETARRIEAKFYVESPSDVGNENLFKFSRPHDYAHIWQKLNKSSFSEPRSR